MGKAHYQIMIALRESCEQQMAALKEPMESLAKDLQEFYEIMRWEGVECSDGQYDQLYENFIYPYEEGRIDEAMENICKFLDSEARKHL